VQIQEQGNVLIVIVEERPTISRMEFTGMKEFDPEIVRKSLKTVGVAEARFYDKAMIDKSEQELKRQYVGKGMYAAEVVATVTPVERNQVAVYFNVDEGPVAKIQEINFIGNEVFSESTLKSEMQLKTGGWLSWYSKDNLYSKQKLTADLESIRSYYLNRGYLEFVIESTQVSITPDKKGIYLTVSIREGKKFTVKGVRLAGETLGKEAELMQLIVLKPGDTFSSAKLTESTKAIAEVLGSYGYAFATINPQPDIRREVAEVDLTLVVDPGRRIYFRKVRCHCLKAEQEYANEVLAKAHPDISFVCTQKFDDEENIPGNIFFTDDIFRDVQDGDINEIAFLSTRAFLIVGKNSGPYMFTHVKENICDPNKIFVSLSHEPSESYAHNTTGFPCHYYHYKGNDEPEITGILLDAMRDHKKPDLAGKVIVKEAVN
jgi:outer membrane translocation and assembly module TamA